VKGGDVLFRSNAEPARTIRPTDIARIERRRIVRRGRNFVQCGPTTGSHYVAPRCEASLRPNPVAQPTIAADDPAQRYRRWAGCAGLAWGAFQLVATRWVSLGYWAGSIAINAVPVLLLAWGALRGSRLSAVGLGIYGVYRIAMAVRMLATFLDSAATQPVDWWVAPLALPFATVWVVGAIATIAPRRDHGVRDTTSRHPNRN
jgi:hypothetical protein